MKAVRKVERGPGLVVEEIPLPEIAKDEGGGVIFKSTSQLNQNQALDDAIRNAQIPPEYEDIVKRLFSRGEVQ